MTAWRTQIKLTPPGVGCRLVRQAGSARPIDLSYWEANGEKGVTLVVTKLDKDDACHMAYVDAARNPQANDQARAIADKDARSFDCKHDEAKHYGPDGQEIKAP